VLVSFAANSLITRYVVRDDLLDAGLRVTGEGLAWAAVMGGGTTAFAYVDWYACQRVLTGAQAGLVQLLIPVLNEPVSVRLLVAAGLVGTGMWLARAAPARVAAPAD